jgi:hypothetical protein
MLQRTGWGVDGDKTRNDMFLFFDKLELGCL